MVLIPPQVIREFAQPTTRAARTVPAAGPTKSSLGEPPLGRVRIAAVGAAQFVEAWVDGVVSGQMFGGGLQVVPKEGGTGTVEFAGVDPDRRRLPVLLDAWIEGRDLTEEWDALVCLARPRDRSKPPLVRLAGAVPPSLLERAWVIEKLEPGERVLSGPNGQGITRIDAIVTLIEPLFFLENVASPLEQARRAAEGTHSSHMIRARPGDTLVSIAARELGDPEKWRELSQLNGGIQPDNVKPGQKVKLP
jgi:hypothetical protein